MSKKQVIKAWGAFTGGKLFTSDDRYYGIRLLSISPTKREARKSAEDVRRVTIIAEKKP